MWPRIESQKMLFWTAPSSTNQNGKRVWIWLEIGILPDAVMISGRRQCCWELFGSRVSKYSRPLYQGCLSRVAGWDWHGIQSICGSTSQYGWSMRWRKNTQRWTEDLESWIESIDVCGAFPWFWLIRMFRMCDWGIPIMALPISWLEVAKIVHLYYSDI